MSRVNRRLLCATALAACGALFACQPEPPFQRCELSADLLARVDARRLLADVRRLVDFGERGSAKQQEVVAAWLAARLQQLGYDTEEQPFTLHYPQHGISISGVNVEARRQSIDAAGGDEAEGDEGEVFLGAHFDSRGDGDAAPGALDNASGTAAVLEIARLLAPCAATRGLRFVLFSKEESGDAGSRKYLEQLARERDGTRTYLNLDMIGCAARASSRLDLRVIAKHAAFGERAKDTTARWTRMAPKLALRDSCIWNTDTGPFCDAGDRALAIHNATDAECWRRIHSSEDTIDLLQDEPFVESTRAALAMLLVEAER